MTTSVALPLFPIKGQQSYSLCLSHHQCICQYRKGKRMSDNYFENIFDLMDPLKVLKDPPQGTINHTLKTATLSLHSSNNRRQLPPPILLRE